MWKGSNYVVLEVISDNGHKAIYRCQDPNTLEKVIIKALHAEASTYEEVLKFRKEYQILSELSRNVKGIVQPVKLEDLGGLYAIVLKDIEGRCLKSILDGRTLDQDTMLDLAIQMVEIVGAIHDNQVIHRDLKPSNLIWNEETGQVQLIDFDLSVKFVKEKQTFQNAGLIEGTLPYIAPEQTGRINRSIDYRADFYSLGVIFYEMFTGVKPHTSGTVMEQIYSIIAKQPPSPYELTKGRVPKTLSDVIMKLMEKSPEDRYRSAYGIKADLQKCRAHEDPFPIGKEDRLHLFRISQKLYGRDQELQELQAAFRESISGQAQLVLVSGEAGVGKTALVNELQTSVSEEQGYFIQGKFEQYHKSVPFSAMLQAFRTLLAQMLQGGGDLTELKMALSQRLGNHAGLLTNMMPELQELVGVQPQIEPLNPTEESNRFLLALISFIECVIGNEKPLVLFLDDLQWADMSSIQILERLAGNAELKRLLVIGSYRDNELANGHPAEPNIEALKQRHNVRYMALPHLRVQDVQDLVQATLASSEGSVAEELGHMLYVKTTGNPFFINEVMKDLHKSRVIAFNDRLGAWQLDAAKISEMTVNDNIVDYLIDKIRRFPEKHQAILSLGAVIGQRFEWKLLPLLSGGDDVSVTQALLHAVHEDILVPLDPDHYQLLAAGSEELPSVQFAFQHDKIQQALYQMLKVETRSRLHLHIGRQLLDFLTPQELETAVIDVANHMSLGIEYIVEQDDRDALLDIYVRAAKRAKLTYGYTMALDFLRMAMTLLTAKAWETDYDQTFLIYRLYAECSYLTHRIEAADQAVSVLIHQASSSLVLASVYEMQSNHYTYLGMMKESIEAGKKGLKTLGLPVPRKVSMASVLRQLVKVKLSLRGRTTEELLEGPEVTDERIKMMMRLLVSFIPPAFISGEQNLFGWVVLKKAYLSARYGNSPESAGAYIGYAILLSGMGDLKGARDFGRLAVDLNEKFGDLQWRSLVYVLYTLFCHSWSYSWDTLEQRYKMAIDSSLMSGDLLYLAHACYYMNLWNPSMEIEQYLQESARSISMIENTKYKEALATAKLARQKFRCLAGEWENPLSLDDDTFSEAQYLSELTEAKYYSGIAIYYITKIQLSYMYGHYEQALPYIEKAYEHIGTLAGSAFMEEFSLYTFLSLAACYPSFTLRKRVQARKRMQKELGRMKKWALHCPENFLTQYELMQAEFARLFSTDETAERHYNNAIQAGSKRSFIRYKALTNELAAKYYDARGLGEMAGFLLRKAAYSYSVWGAKGKVSQLEHEYPAYLGELTGPLYWRKEL
ncbi:ATP-binding protein [Paenibacillus hexagrammi]|uniref:Serine/threonine-protein kinase PknK n=1 Tax=Paenibacillus hexagrammi TaxID=2908839 RepID=A0ABY3SJW6_9BACL|nr:serine/threonine-protein kinase PknK [Paenibacillus sp. YPD9-1]UJF33406.1 serine/threonine-protein kinase PknK [Paenibacillus sp. YPD9-1]